ncbi:PmoA family protein [Saccharopolyspora griseoalba]|uniref:PmoA family protein n=1 Tax=Saccharopolyspora griseoalba TaxID=1431848 RepID=A0ABW2LQM9_9PSEU
MGEPMMLRIDGFPVAEYPDGADLPASLGPRPHLHPVRTLGGRVVTDALPEDHRWHLGFSVALQDVDNWNFWGGRTYVRDRGYTELDDHGRIEHVSFPLIRDDGFAERLRWRSGAGEVLVDESRDVRARRVEAGWELALSSTLGNATEREIELGSPATNGRTGAGYGGLFWRLPPAVAPRVFTAAASGERAVHGSVAPWLAWTDRDFTLALTGIDEATRADPWFVRVDDYPGVGSQLAAVRPVALPAGGALTRGLRVLIADGALDAMRIAAWAGSPRS